MTQIKGIDISKYQGIIDWAKVVSSGVKFVLIRAGFGNDISQKDVRFDENVRGALAHGLHVGAYWFSYAISVQDAINESKVFKQVLAPYKGKLDFPVGYDYEYDSITYSIKNGVNPSNALINAMATSFLNSMKADGWFVNLYTNNDFIKSGRFSNSTFVSYDIWLADYVSTPDYACGIQQTGSTGFVSGIVGSVDTDVAFKDYPSIIRAGGYNGFVKPQIANFKSDTTKDVSVVLGQAYQFKITSTAAIAVTVGTSGVATLLPRYKIGSDSFYYLVGIGKVGAAAGVFVNGIKQFVIRIK